MRLEYKKMIIVPAREIGGDPDVGFDGGIGGKDQVNAP